MGALEALARRGRSAGVREVVWVESRGSSSGAVCKQWYVCVVLDESSIVDRASILGRQARGRYNVRRYATFSHTVAIRPEPRRLQGSKFSIATLSRVSVPWSVTLRMRSLLRP